LPVKEVHNLRGKKEKGLLKKESQWPPSSKQTQGQPMVETSRKTSSKRKKANDLPFKKERKRNIPSMMMMSKEYLMSLWLQKPFLSQN